MAFQRGDGEFQSEEPVSYPVFEACGPTKGLKGSKNPFIRVLSSLRKTLRTLSLDR